MHVVANGFDDFIMCVRVRVLRIAELRFFRLHLKLTSKWSNHDSRGDHIGPGNPTTLYGAAQRYISVQTIVTGAG